MANPKWKLIHMLFWQSSLQSHDDSPNLIDHVQQFFKYKIMYSNTKYRVPPNSTLGQSIGKLTCSCTWRCKLSHRHSPGGSTHPGSWPTVWTPGRRPSSRRRGSWGSTGRPRSAFPGSCEASTPAEVACKRKWRTGWTRTRAAGRRRPSPWLRSTG